LADLAMIAGGDADAVPTEASVREFAKVKAEVDGYADRWSKIVTEDVPKFDSAAGNLKVLIVRRP